MGPMTAIVRTYATDDVDSFADAFEWRVEHIEDMAQLDDGPTRPVEVDLEALRRSCGQIAVITRCARVEPVLDWVHDEDE